MTNALATLAVAILLTGTVVAQPKPPKRWSKNKSAAGSATDAASTNSKKDTQSTVAGTGLTNDQYQTQSADNSTDKATKVDASSSVRTGPSPVKARKKSPKSGN